MSPMALPGGSIACHSRLGIALAAHWQNIGSALASNRSGQFAGPIVVVLGCNLFVEESDERWNVEGQKPPQKRGKPPHAARMLKAPAGTNSGEDSDQRGRVQPSAVI